MLTTWAIAGTYMTLLGVLALYGAHRAFLLWALRTTQGSTPAKPSASSPRVTIQLPLYNEPAVARRLIDAVAHIHWPTDKLQIQVLDDSTDITAAIVDQAVAQWSAKGLDIAVLRRADRTGYKAGALAHGLASATGEYIAILDADFVPGPDFLMQLMPHFRSGVGMVQARWGHINRNQSWLTRMQAMLLDAHFVIEHAARHQSGRFFNFNGTAGIWRRACIEDAGGWTHDTITEDLDLSYRAQLVGWQFVFLSHVVVPAELPRDMPAFLTQQHRWAKGTVQTARKLLRRLAQANLPWQVRLEALIHLTCPIGYPLLIVLAALLPPAVASRAALNMDSLIWLDLVAVVMTMGSMVVFFGTAIQAQGRPLRHHLLEIPMTLALGVGMAPSQTLAVIDGLTSGDTTFVRTPKHGQRNTSLTSPPAAARPAAQLLTLALAVYFTGAVIWALQSQHWGSLPFMLLFTVGFWMVSVGLLPPVRRKAATEAGTGRGEAHAAK